MASRLERLNRLRIGQRVRVQFGNLTTLSEDYTGPRHVVAVKQLPPRPNGEEWYEWEERPGPEPPLNGAGPDNEIRIRVCYVNSD